MALGRTLADRATRPVLSWIYGSGDGRPATAIFSESAQPVEGGFVRMNGLFVPAGSQAAEW